MKERRREERHTPEWPGLFSAEFETAKESGKKGQIWRLNVSDCSDYGLGLLISKTDSELLWILNPGDVIMNMGLYSEWAKIQITATVKYISKVKSGPYKDQFILGVESRNIIDICQP